MGSKTPLLMITALVCGLGAAYGTYKLLSGAQQQAQMDEKVTVLVPKADIKQYLTVSGPIENLFQTQEVSKREIRDLDDVVREDKKDLLKDKTARFNLRAGKPVYFSELMDNKQVSVTADLGPGEVAKTIKVSATSAGPFVQVGNRVDIMARIAGETNDLSEIIYILSNIQVLGINNVDVRDPSGNKIPPDTFTLRVTREQAQMLTAHENSLNVVLRKDGDTFDATTSAPMGGKKKTPPPSIVEEQPKVEVAKEEKKPEPAKEVAKDEKPETKYWSVEITEKQEKTHILTINDGGTGRKSVQFPDTKVALPPKVRVEVMSEEKLAEFKEKHKGSEIITIKVLGEEKGPKPEADKSEKVSRSDSN